MSQERFSYTERDLLIQLREQFKSFTEEVRRNNHNLEFAFKDMERRIRILENFRWWIIGAAAGAGFLGNIIAHLFIEKK